MEKDGYRFSFGPWNIHTGADPFGPRVRAPRTFDEMLEIYKALGFDAVQFHDRLVELTGRHDGQAVDELIAARGYEQLDSQILSHLMGQT
jgi:sugar phosphate isomerase/epimerase